MTVKATAALKIARKGSQQRKRGFRLAFLAPLLLAIGCFAGCIFPSPEKRSVNEALAWQKVAERLRQTDPSISVGDLNKILRPVRQRKHAEAFQKLVQNLNAGSDGKNWLLGRAYLFAGVAYLSAAQIALANRKAKDSRQYCLLAAENFVKASQLLPLWERRSVLRWAAQLRQIAGKLDAEPFYALTHLKAVSVKAEKHASFVPPIRQGR